MIIIMVMIKKNTAVKTVSVEEGNEFQWVKN